VGINPRAAIKRYLDALKGSKPTSTGYVQNPGGLGALDSVIQDEAQLRYSKARAAQNVNIANDWIADYHRGDADKKAVMQKIGDILGVSETPLSQMIKEQKIQEIALRAAMATKGSEYRHPLAPNTIIQAINQPFGVAPYSGRNRALAYGAAASGGAAGLTAAGLGLADLMAYIAGGNEQAQARETSPVLAQQVMEEEASLLSNPLVARINDPGSW